MSASIPASNSNNWSAELNRARSDDPATRRRAARASVSIAPGGASGCAFRQQRLGYWSLVDLRRRVRDQPAGPLWSNDKPLVVRYEGHLLFSDREDLRGDHLRRRFPDARRLPRSVYPRPLQRAGNFAVYPPNHYYYDTLNYFSKALESGAAVARELARHRRSRPRCVRAAAVRLSRVGADSRSC